jgi:GT2 family glycosyltransferase
MYAGLVVSYNDLEGLKRCIASLNADENCSMILVLDNASSPQNKRHLKKLLQNKNRKLRIDFLDKNYGFARAVNFGFKKLRELNFDYVFLLNQDAYLLSNSAGSMISDLQSDEAVLLVSPIHLSDEQMKLDQPFESYIEKYFKVNRLNHQFINAAAWMIDMEKLYEVGFFNPLFFMYGEDYNLCQRVYYWGLKIAYSERVSIVHSRDSAYYNRSFKRVMLKSYGYWLSQVLNPFEEMSLMKFNEQVFRRALRDLYHLEINWLIGSLVALCKITIRWKLIQSKKTEQFFTGPFT